MEKLIARVLKDKKSGTVWKRERRTFRTERKAIEKALRLYPYKNGIKTRRGRKQWEVWDW